MKTRTFVSILILVLAVLVIAGNCATGKKAYLAEEDEELYGIWINTQEAEAKVVVYSDGIIEFYISVSDEAPNRKRTYTITAKWEDSKGNIWNRYEDWYEGAGLKKFRLVKLSDSSPTSPFFRVNCSHAKS